MTMTSISIYDQPTTIDSCQDPKFSSSSVEINMKVNVHKRTNQIDLIVDHHEAGELNHSSLEYRIQNNNEITDNSKNAYNSR